MGCTHCHAWRYFTLDDLVYHNMLCVHDAEKARKAKEAKKRGCCNQWKRMLASIIFAFPWNYR
jgi:hypothetical protein